MYDFQGIPSQFHDLIGYRHGSFAIMIFIKDIFLEKRMKIDKEFVFLYELFEIMKLGQSERKIFFLGKILIEFDFPTSD